MFDPATLLGARAPRYTSYPTAPNFHAGIDERVYRRWLEALAAQSPISLYVHVPFCDTLCWFCGCHTTVVNRYTPVRSYCDLLAEEIEMVAAALGRKAAVGQIHWGGGSPSMLSPDDVVRLAGAIRANFRVLPEAEFAIEIDPRGFGAEHADALAAAGLTRASIGVQDCDPLVQRAINRVQSMETTRAAVDLLRARAVSSLNIDLIYGLPHQSVAGLDRTIDFALSLDPDRLAVFGYAHVPHFKKHQKLIHEEALPGPKERFEQAMAAHARISKHSYVPVGIDHFAKPSDALAIALRQGRLRRNFQGYTTDAAPALIGIGASAIGAMPQGYVQNVPEVPAYRAALAAGRLPVARGVTLSDEDRLRRCVIERLMCNLEADLGAAAAAHGASSDVFAPALAGLAPLIAAGIVDTDGRKLAVRPQWRALTRVVCAAFDAYLAPGAARHALAV
ncbi:MAG TPA: oxygen-independent coproporphyrinogen III oxidase [Rhizomicrobium sp.]|nr:oxygen-independent coproporphyrinogen III oxidase [Rhizomicrobium sp.]